MRYLLTGVAALSLISFTACGQAGASGQVERADVEKIVKEYILENPEILEEAFAILEAREERAALDTVREDVFNNPRDISVGPKDAKVTIVEFFDYNCGYCKRSTEWLRGIMDEHGDDVRVIFKETPLLDGRTKTSKNAAKAALAAARQGKYTTLHFSLMKERSLTPERVLEIAEKAGLDMDKLEKDMKDPAIEHMINEALILTQRMPMFGGTPFFFINDEYVSGANTPKLDSLLKTALGS